MIAWLCRCIYGMIGWQLSGRYPHDLDKMIIIVAPHTSSIDLWVGLLANFGWNIRGQFYGKQELFNGLQGRILRLLGGLPIDRSGGKDTVQAVVDDIHRADRRIVVLAPEGTRERVEHFKTGFYYMAYEADIPILPAVFDYENKTIHLKELIYVSGDADREIPMIENLFKGVRGRIPEKSFHYIMRK